MITEHSISLFQNGWIRIVASVLAAAFGVQSDANRERDFNEGRIWPYIVVGLVFAVVLVVVIFLLVSWVSQTYG